MEMLTALDDLEAASDKLASLPVTTLSAGQVLAVLDRLETQRRRQPAVEHALLNHLQAQATAKDMGAKSWRAVLAQRLGISSPDAGRRLAEAAVLGPRRALTGEPLEPHLSATATAQARGEIGTDHVTIIRDFIDHLPADLDPGTRTAAEAQLGGLAGGLTPEGLRKLARQLLGYLDSDGTLDDEREHARKRGLTLGAQGLDGMSRLTGWITPELRATLDAAFAKLAAPGYCNPEDQTPCLDGVPAQHQIDADTRSPAQRSHDALQTVCRAMLASGTLGQHNGLPVTIVATTTLAELTAAAGLAHTGGGTQLPIPTRTNLVQARKFSEQLEEAINRYTNRSLSTAEIIAELVKLAKEMRDNQKRHEALGLAEDEVAFYDAIAQNDAAVLEMGDETLKKIAHELVQAVRASATIDWNLKDSVKAAMRLKVKKLLAKYDYPPDQEARAVELVLQQAELFAGSGVA